MSITESDTFTIIKAIKERGLLDKIALISSIWFGAGLLPGMPGTFGTVAAIPLYVAGSLLGPQYQFSILLIIAIGAIWSSHRSQRILGSDDPPVIVVDEVAGFLLTTAFIPFTWPALAGGFFLFRFFDILKPPPIKTIEKKLKGGIGIVLDDLLAGVYAHISLRLLLFMLN
ncbi:MAG TPA: phosphatidylglycerophosphatase A [Desulfatiglandales bacterium]|nr:phosphatidylglycerophosphatase A [Desulfatiglandales bacterium]